MGQAYWWLTYNIFWRVFWSSEPVKEIFYQITDLTDLAVKKIPHLCTILKSVYCWLWNQSVGNFIPWNSQLPVLIARWATGCLQFQFWNPQLVLSWTRAVWVTKQAFIALKFFTIHHGSCKVFSVFFGKSVRLKPFLSQAWKLCVDLRRANGHACDLFRFFASPLLGLGSFTLNRKQSVKLDIFIYDGADLVHRSILYHLSARLPNI